MRRLLVVSCLAVSLAIFAPLANAHVTLRPAEAPPGTTTTYTVRVPSEGESATTSVELDIPAGVTFVSAEGTPGTFELKKTGDQVTSIVWKTAIPAGERAELTFVAKNPATGAEIAWKAHQFYADGTRADWVEPKGSKRPGPVTTLKAGP
jgi:uncharacterized protein YcnI